MGLTNQDIIEMLELLKDNASEREEGTYIKDVLLDSFRFVINVTIQKLKEDEK